MPKAHVDAGRLDKIVEWRTRRVLNSQRHSFDAWVQQATDASQGLGCSILVDPQEQRQDDVRVVYKWLRLCEHGTMTPIQQMWFQLNSGRVSPRVRLHFAGYHYFDTLEQAVAMRRRARDEVNTSQCSDIIVEALAVGPRVVRTHGNDGVGVAAALWLSDHIVFRMLPPRH